MSNSSLSLDDLFGDMDLDAAPDLDDEVEPLPEPPRVSKSALPTFFAHEAEATLDVVGFTTASAFLSDAEPAGRPTRPYDIPADEFAQALGMWGDDERFSTVSTMPVSLEELPDDAYPTRFTLIEPDWLPLDGFGD